MDGEVQGVAPDLDIVQIMDLIPHRYPFLLIDRLEQIVPNESAVGIKNVTMNEPYFQGHFPGRPIMPGVLIIEAMAQTAACLVVSSLLATTGAPKLVYFMSIDEAKFRKPVTPGDRLMIHVTKERNRANVWRFKGVAKVGDQIMAEAVYTAMIVNN